MAVAIEATPIRQFLKSIALFVLTTAAPSQYPLFQQIFIRSRADRLFEQMTKIKFTNA
jgi:hypothetical protein